VTSYAATHDRRPQSRGRGATMRADREGREGRNDAVREVEMEYGDVHRGGDQGGDQLQDYVLYHLHTAPC